MLRELGIGLVAYSPLGRGVFTGKLRSPTELADDDWRKNNPRFSEENWAKNQPILDEVEALAREAGATSAQVALAWLLAQGDDIAPIPGTKRVERVEESSAADTVTLTAAQLARLGALRSPAGDRYDAGNMASLDR